MGSSGSVEVTGSSEKAWGSLDPFGEYGVTGIYWESLGIIESGGRMGSLDPVEECGVSGI